MISIFVPPGKIQITNIIPMNMSSPTLDISLSLADLVRKNFQYASILEKYRIDFCCGGEKSLAEACRAKGLNPEEILNALTLAGPPFQGDLPDFENSELDFLADYIVKTHHQYVSKNLPILHDLGLKIVNVHGPNHPEVIEILPLFEAIREELTHHMMKEEVILFPSIIEMVQNQRDGLPLQPPPFGSIANPIRMMEAEHTSAGGNFEKIYQLSQGYTPPSDACASFRLFYEKLKEFEQDLHQHIHLENNILFPKAIQMEKKMLA